MPFDAENDNEYGPALPMLGVPDKVPVPLPLSTKVTPDGSAPVSDNDGCG